MTARILACLTVLAAGSHALAQNSNVLPSAKFAWGENVGFLNFRDAGSPAASQGAVVAQYILRGFVWGENIGWINLGNGAPANNVQYSNAMVGPTLDFGVNRNPANGNLSGFAWSENCGWINFSGGALATPAQPARFNSATGRLEGYAWAENLGWINLNAVDPANGKAVAVAFGCSSADIATEGSSDLATGPDGFITGTDFDAFILAFFTAYQSPVTGALLADIATSGTAAAVPDGFLTGEDFDLFIQVFFQGC
ncbi:MAG: hypothetical protein KIT68_10320 [Phycisphaeraceae bacterium]|nr:hypothetical protein [Phycisphaeraceae bacterium]